MGSWVWHVRENRVYWSDELFKILGLDRETHQASTEAFFARIHPDDLPGLQAASAKMAETGEASIRSVRIVRPSGEVRSIRMSSNQVRDEDGTPLRMVGTLLDTTTMVAKENELERTLGQLNDAQRIANLGSFYWDLERDEISWSQQMYRIFEKDPSTYQPKVDELLQLIHPDDREVLQERALSTERSQKRPTECRAVLDGVVRHLLVETKIVPTQDGSARALHGTIADVTERKKLEAQLRQSQKMDALGKLAGGVAHDLNNYLQIITGSADVLGTPQLEHEDDEDFKQARDDLQASLRLCTSLTRGLLAFSRQQNVEARTVDLHQLITSSLQLAGKLLGADVRTRVQLLARETAVFADPHQLQQVLINLAINARDAMDGSGTLEVRTDNGPPASTTDTKEPGEAHVFVHISDSGCGMSEEVLSQIFDPFFTTKGEGHGTGLGLSTAYGIIHQSRGSLSATSQEGQGSTFTIQLPLTRASRPSRAPESVPGPRSAKGARAVLVVEDEPMVRRMAVTVLRRAGYDVIEANDGRDALALLGDPEAPRIDLMLSDMVMPNLGGTALLDELKRQGLELPTVLMTGYANRDAHNALSSPGCPILQKPFTPQELLQTIGELEGIEEPQGE